MRKHWYIRRFATGFLACVMLCGLSAPIGRAEVESPATLPDSLLEDLLLEWQAQQATLEQLRAQQASTLQAIELTRREISTALSQNVGSTLARLDTMNEVLVVQREHDLEFIRNSNRRVLTVLSCLASLLFLAMLLLTVLSTRAMNRLSAALSASSFAHPQLNALATAGLLTESGAAQLQSTLERLEQRIAELENHSAPSSPQGSRETNVTAA
jgi:BMFP domain-containing protein YqiC